MSYPIRFSIVVLFFFCMIQACISNKKIVPGLSHTIFNPTTETLHFLVIGDWGRNGKYHQQDVAAQMNIVSKEMHPSFIISTGDNFYPNGVTSVHDKQWLTSFEHIYSGQYLQCPWYPVLGNHDYRGNPQVEVDYTNKNSRWTMPDRYYTLSKKINEHVSARFIFLDTNPLERKDTLQQLKWLDSVLNHSSEQWKIIVGHHPLYSSNPRHGNSETMIALLKNRMTKHNVQLYLAGHDHDLQHQHPKGNVDYIVSGAGSQTRRSSVNNSTLFAKNISGFASIGITSDSLTLQFIDYKGQVLYTYSRGK